MLTTQDIAQIQYLYDDWEPDEAQPHLLGRVAGANNLAALLILHHTGYLRRILRGWEQPQRILRRDRAAYGSTSHQRPFWWLYPAAHTLRHRPARLGNNLIV